MVFPQDLARIRYENAMLLFDEFVRATVAAPDAATLRGLERRFAERLQIQPSYWSQIKSRSRQIGERLARQFEQLCRKPAGWMDLAHGSGTSIAATAARTPAATGTTVVSPETADAGPRDDDERFIVGLVLTYYRRHPQRARTRLLDLLGEVLTPSATGPAPDATPGPARAAGPAARTPPATATPDDRSLWSQVQAGVAPLKKKR